MKSQIIISRDDPRLRGWSFGSTQDWRIERRKSFSFGAELVHVFHVFTRGWELHFNADGGEFEAYVLSPWKRMLRATVGDGGDMMLEYNDGYVHYTCARDYKQDSNFTVADRLCIEAMLEMSLGLQVPLPRISMEAV